MSKWKRNIDAPFKPQNMREMHPKDRLEANSDLAKKLAAEALSTFSARIYAVGGNSDDMLSVSVMAIRNMAWAVLGIMAEDGHLTVGHAMAMRLTGQQIEKEAQDYLDRSKKA